MQRYHCDQLMRSERIPLISGRIQYDHRCAVCGQHTREIYSAAGLAIRWRNMTLLARLAPAETVE